MPPALTINIDEAGDPGVKDGLRYLGERHEWMCFGALAVRSVREPQVRDWVRELREEARSRQSAVLHYTKISRDRRTAVASLLAKKPCQAFVLASHKSNLRDYINPRIGSMGADTFYNWCFRLLLERVTAWAERWQKRELRDLEPLEIILEERGGHDYDHLFAYIDRLRMQAETGTLLLKGPGLHPTLLDRTYWRVERKSAWAGLQLADLVASAFYQAANAASPAFDPEPAIALRPIIARNGTDAVNAGLTLFPLPHQAVVPPECRRIFEEFGYGF
jgi:hypothetical protein